MRTRPWSNIPTETVGSANVSFIVDDGKTSTRPSLPKLTTALEEADESQYWLEHLRDCGLASKPPLLAEASELVAILTKSVETARRNRGRW